jgi:pimeloyl-ACP methyl ester carboxylesterase
MMPSLDMDATGVMKATLRARDKARWLAVSALLNVFVATGLALTAVDNTALISEAVSGLLLVMVGGDGGDGRDGRDGRDSVNSMDSMAAGFAPFVGVVVWAASLSALFVAIHALFEHATLAMELAATPRSEACAWRSGGKQFYKGAKHVALRISKDTNFQRHVAVVVRNLPCAQTHNTTTPCFMFVHGSMARLGQFGALMDLCEQRGFGVFAYDQFGMGRSGGRYLILDDGLDAYTSSSFSREELLLDLFAAYEQCCEQAGPDTPVIICAHSFGCQLALELALNITDPLCFDMTAATPAGVVLLGSQGPVEQEQERATVAAKRLFSLPCFVLRLIRPLLSGDFKKRAFHPDTLSSLEGKRQGKSPGGDAVARERSRYLRNVLEYASALSGANSMAVCKAFYMQTLGTGVSAKRLERQRDVLPLVHLATGESDQLTSPGSGRKMAEVLGSRAVYTEIRSAGHQCMEEQPEAVFGVLCEVAASLGCQKKKGLMNDVISI